MQILKDQIYAAILSAAAELFLKNGYENTSLAGISARAGVSKSNLYNYFSSKQEIYRRLTDGSARRLKAMIEDFRRTDYVAAFSGGSLLPDVADRIFLLFQSERTGLLLLLRGTRGTGREELLNELVSVFTSKCERYLPKSPAGGLLSSVVTRDLLNGMIDILTSGRPDGEMLDCLRLLVRYHSAGAQALIFP